MKKTISKALSVFLAVVMLVLSAPIVLAAEPVALTTSNVTEWPTATYISGEAMYFGQKVGDAIALTGGKVEYNGVEIPGYFEHIDPTTVPTSTGTIRVDMKFVPEDANAYTGFEKKRSRDVTYSVSTTTPVYVDEANDPLVASEIEAGAALSTSTLSGGTMTNPYNAEEPELLSTTWEWLYPDTIVQESGYFEAVFRPAWYTATTAQVYVKVAGDVPNSEITENPTANVTYNPNLKWGDVELQGGKAVIKGTETEVPGTFAVTDKWKDVTPSVRNTKVEVKFTPDDETQALPYIFEIPVTVNKAAPAFKTDDESGIPTITMPYGTKIDSSLDVVIKRLVDVDVPVYIAYKDLNGNNLEYSGKTPTVGEHEIQVRINIDDSNYQSLTMLTYKLVITPLTIKPSMRVVDADHYKIVDQDAIAYNAAKPTGTFIVSYTINGEKQPDIITKYGDAFAVDDSRSGEYVFTISYNEIENDPFVIEDFETTKREIHDRKANINGELVTYPYGTPVTLVAPATDPAQPGKPYYGFVKWVDANGNTGLSEEELENKEITFAMPDGDVDLDATYRFDFSLCIKYYVQIVVDFFTSFFQSIGTLF